MEPMDRILMDELIAAILTQAVYGDRADINERGLAVRKEEVLVLWREIREEIGREEAGA